MLVVTGGILATVIVLNYHHRKPETHHMPRWASLIFDFQTLWLKCFTSLQMKMVFLKWLPPILLMKRPRYKSKKSRSVSQSISRVPSRPSQLLLATVLTRYDPNNGVGATPDSQNNNNVEKNGDNSPVQ